MQPSDALPLIESLASGVDPRTGDGVAEDSPLHHPEVIRALFLAVRLIESHGNLVPADSNRSRPARAGEPWSDQEEQRLSEAFQAGVTFAQLAERHQRSRAAISSRLARLGLIEEKPRKQNDSKIASANSEERNRKWWQTERPNTGKPWGDEEDSELRTLVGKGFNVSEMARRLGRGENSVQVRLFKLGLTSDSNREVNEDDVPF